MVGPTSTWRGFAVALVLAALTLPAPVTPAGAAEPTPRTFWWSGYRWTVRTPAEREDPGGNRWGDSRANVRVQSDKTLRLDIVRGRAVEVVGPPTGYGRYRWVVKSAMDGVDPFRVIAFFVRGTGGEQDIEFSRWGEAYSTTPGTWVTWRRRTRKDFGYFNVSPAAPYTIDIDWRRRATRFSVRDATGASLLDRTAPTSQGGRHMAPRISYWLYPGHGSFLSPFTRASAHPLVIVKSFRYTKRKARAAP
jgi:hypothetical protein